MTQPSLDIVAIGDALVDVIATCDEAFLVEHRLPKGMMQLLDTESADRLYAAMGQAREMSGGSAANTMAGVAAMGGKAAFIGQVADDQLGEIFQHDMRALGVRFDTRPLSSGSDYPTGRCLILVTPDTQRTMNTCPGASHQLRPEALDEQLIASASILMLEGYLWGPELPRQAMERAIAIAHDADRKVAFTLSESVCLHDRREGMLRVIQAGAVDLMFANEHEAMQLTGTSDLGEALAQLSAKVATLVITRGPQGALGLEHGEGVEIPAHPVAKVVDTTGAGDLYAAGFMVGLSRRLPLPACGRLGALAAAEVISHVGARPMRSLTDVAGTVLR